MACEFARLGLLEDATVEVADDVGWAVQGARWFRQDDVMGAGCRFLFHDNVRCEYI